MSPGRHRDNLQYPCLRLELAMRKIRVLVANKPRLMRDLVLATISEQPDIEVLGSAADGEAAGRTRR